MARKAKPPIEPAVPLKVKMRERSSYSPEISVAQASCGTCIRLQAR